MSAADLPDRLGVPAERLRLFPPPGTATVQDVIALDAHEGRVYELVEGTLIEKLGGMAHGRLSMVLGAALVAFVRAGNLGVVTGFAGTIQLRPGLVRIPDAAFTSWDRIPGRRWPDEPVPHLVPDLAVEVLSESNSPGEMLAKRNDSFTAGVRLVWEIDPRQRAIAVYTSPPAPDAVLVVGRRAGWRGGPAGLRAAPRGPVRRAGPARVSRPRSG